MQVIYTNATGGWPALETWQRDRMIGLVTDSPLDAGTPQVCWHAAGVLPPPL